jgi:DNA-binding XRE family transcriptional regulator
LTLTAKKPSKSDFNPKTLGDHIKKRRLEFGLYQAQVAKILGVTESTIVNWEKNRSKPSLRSMPKVTKFLGYCPFLCVPKTLGKKLLGYREHHGVTQKELAKQIGIDPTTLSRLERGLGKCLGPVLERVTTFLEVHIVIQGCPLCIGFNPE